MTPFYSILCFLSFFALLLHLPCSIYSHTLHFFHHFTIACYHYSLCLSLVALLLFFTLYPFQSITLPLMPFLEKTESSILTISHVYSPPTIITFDGFKHLLRMHVPFYTLSFDTFSTHTNFFPRHTFPIFIARVSLHFVKQLSLSI